MQPYRKPQKTAKITPLRVVEHPNALGAHLRYVRERQQNVSPQDIAHALPEYFEEYSVTFPTANPQDTYRKIEKGIRAVQYEELIPLYATMIGCGICQSAEERHKFVLLARQKLESLQRKRPKTRPDSQWEWLEAQLAKIDQQKSPVQSAFDAALSDNAFDISHVVGRDHWLKTALSYLHTTPPKKLVIIQAMMGMGKTTCLKLLLHTLSEQDDYQPILHLFSDREDMTSSDHLDNFLATILARREVIIPETKIPNRHEQIKLLLKDLSQSEERVVLLLDDVQIILDEHGQLPPVWQDFFTEFLQRPHQATIYLATRQWSLWPGRDPVYVVDGDKALLPKLSSEAGAQIWQRFGFGDVDEELLHRLSEKCEGHPQLIEQAARKYQPKQFVFSFQKGELATLSSEKSIVIQELEHLLEQPLIFDLKNIDHDLRTLLEQAISQRLSPEAVLLLEVLAVSPLPIAASLLEMVCPDSSFARSELLHHSLITVSAGRYQRFHLLQLVRVAIAQRLPESRVDELENIMISLYQKWLELEWFADDQEQSMLITELLVYLLKHHRLLEAAQVLLRSGWRSITYGYTSRLARLTDVTLFGFDWTVDLAQKVGGTLLYYYYRLSKGRKVSAQERFTAYQEIYRLIQSKQVSLELSAKLHIIHHLIQGHVANKHFAEANELCEAMSGWLNQHVQREDIESYALAMHSKAYFFGRWSDHKEEQGELEEATRLRYMSVETLQQGIDLLHVYETHASSLTKRNIQFRLARFLNDYAFRQRLLGNLDQAQLAIQECLPLKESGLSLPISLAISLDEYTQLLILQGKFQEAQISNIRALQIVQKLMDEGDKSVSGEKGMILARQAIILLQQGKLSQAKPILEQVLPLTSESRQKYHVLAQEKLAMIEVQRSQTEPFHLDARWFERYQPLADYSTISAFTQAGLFTNEEQKEWETLFARYQLYEPLEGRMAELINASRKRELALSREERREPCLLYPLLDGLIHDIQNRLLAFEHLKTDIATQEGHAIVRQLYLDTIDEHLETLRMLQATYRRNTSEFSHHNQHIYSVPSEQEMAQAFAQFQKLILRGLSNERTRPLAEQLSRQLRRWRIPSEYLDVEYVNEQPLVEKKRENYYAPSTIRLFLEHVLHLYRFDRCKVAFDPTKNHEHVNKGMHTIFLPMRELAAHSVYEMLGEELEIHLYRSEVGYRSPLALLSSGTQNYSTIEEGMALHYVEEIAAAHGYPRSFSWIGTLATGLASGVVSVPLTFSELTNFLEIANTVSNLLKGKSQEQARDKARQDAEDRALRTYRGVPDLTVRGCCSLRDSVYLRGYNLVDQATQENITFDQLCVGAVSREALPALVELDIVRPMIPHQKIALDPDLDEWIETFDETH